MSGLRVGQRQREERLERAVRAWLGGELERSAKKVSKGGGGWKYLKQRPAAASPLQRVTRRPFWRKRRKATTAPNQRGAVVPECSGHGQPVDLARGQQQQKPLKPVFRVAVRRNRASFKRAGADARKNPGAGGCRRVPFLEGSPWRYWVLALQGTPFSSWRCFFVQHQLGDGSANGDWCLQRWCKQAPAGQNRRPKKKTETRGGKVGEHARDLTLLYREPGP